MPDKLSVRFLFFPKGKIYVMGEVGVRGNRELALNLEAFAFIFKLLLLKSCLAFINTNL